MKHFGEKETWAYPETAQFFWIPPIISGTGKAMDFTFGQYIQRVHRYKILLKIWRKGSVGVSRDCPNFLGTPISGREKLRISNLAKIWPIYSEGPSEQNPINNFGKKGASRAWVSWDCPIFRVPPIISGTGKATKFKLCTHIYRFNRNKSTLKISGKVAVGTGHSQGLPKIFRAPLYTGRISRVFLR